MTISKAALLVRLSPELKEKLVELARRERRSLSKQVELLLEKCFLQEKESSSHKQKTATMKSRPPRDRNLTQ
jgi:hypothetical protein